jgi:tRNA/tmRNA/rRNA uracil-C5-methylase (TrmA/RlmC/RlmD family)
MCSPATDLPAPGAALELAVGEAIHGGWCVARTAGAGGPVILVRHALPGERVRAVITQTTSTFARADAVQILDAAPDRVTPPCPHARPGGCGGCDWQHASLPAQRALKADVIRQQLQRIAGISREVTVQPLPGEQNGLGWRTRVRFAVRPDGVAGLHKHRSRDVIEVGHCPIAHSLVSGVGAARRRWPGIREVEVVAAPGSGQRAVIVAGEGGRSVAWAEVAADAVLASRGGGAPAAVRGRGYLTQRAAGRNWRVGAGVFWQVHPQAADSLAAAACAALRPQPGDRALDLYCGAGLFAGVLAEAVGPGGMVLGVDSDAAAVRDARHNLRATPWARVRRGDVAVLLPRDGLSGASLAVLDPPRAGAPRPVIEALCAPPGDGGPGLRRVAYVSCDPATMARDIALFRARGWELDALTGYDAFPMTHHVECLATLVPGEGCRAC